MHKNAAAVRLALEGPIFALVEDWRRSQPKIPSRNEAIRLLLRRALERPPEKLSDAQWSPATATEAEAMR
jgi:hypothetical protein